MSNIKALAKGKGVFRSDKMDVLQQNINHLLPAVDSLIRREVDCLIDDLLMAKTVSLLNDPFPFDLNHLFVARNQKEEQNTESKKRDVLLCVSFDGENEEFIREAKEFKQKGNQVLTITTNRHSTLAEMSDRVVGFNLKVSEIDKEFKTALYEQVIYILFSTIKQSMIKRIPTHT